MPDPQISEVYYSGGGNSDFIEFILPAGSDPSDIEIFIYNAGGNVVGSHSLGPVVATEQGYDIYLVETNLNKNFGIAVVNDGNLEEFYSFGRTITAKKGPAKGESSDQIGTVSDNGSSLVSDDGINFTESAPPTPGTLGIPCFCRGTLIETELGPLAVEYLHTGMNLLTSDGELSEILWISNGRLTAADGDYAIRIGTGAFGPNLPARDLFVSPNHRIALSSPQAALLFGAQHVLIAAKHLLGVDGIEEARDDFRPEVFHILLDRHRLILSNGLASESYYPGAMTLPVLAMPERAEILRLFPRLKYDPGAYGPTALPVLRGHEVHAILNTPDYDLGAVAA